MAETKSDAKSSGSGGSPSSSSSQRSRASSSGDISTVAAVVHGLLSGALTEDSARKAARESLIPLLPEDHPDYQEEVEQPEDDEKDD